MSAKAVRREGSRERRVRRLDHVAGRWATRVWPGCVVSSAVAHLVLALFFAVTIIGLPLAAQHLKMTRLALLPFGFEVRSRF